MKPVKVVFNVFVVLGLSCIFGYGVWTVWQVNIKHTTPVAAVKPSTIPQKSLPVPLQGKDNTQAATYLLFAQTDEGGMKMLCSAFTFRHYKDQGYLMATAGHCVAQWNPEEKKIMMVDRTYYVMSDDKLFKTFIPVTAVSAGDQQDGDDFAILTMETAENYATLDLGDEGSLQSGSAVASAGAPHGLTKVLALGSVGSLRIDRPMSMGPPDCQNWHNYMMLDMKTEAGQSGGPVTADGKVVGIVIGRIGSWSIAMPISRLTTKLKAVGL